MKNIFIIGANGYIGKNIIKFLIKQKLLKIFVFTRNLDLLPDYVHKKCIIYKIDLCDLDSLNINVPSESILINLAYIKSSRIKNKKAMNNLVNFINKKKFNKVIHLSSSAIYGSKRSGYINESSIPLPNSHYEKIKYDSELIIRSTIDKNIKLIILRPTEVFGFNSFSGPYIILRKLLNNNIIINRLLNSILYHRKTNFLAIENLFKVLYFFIFMDVKFNQNTFIVSSDDDIDNNYFKIYSIISDRLNGNNKILFMNLILPKFFLIILLKLFNRTPIDRFYDNSKLLKFTKIKFTSLKESINKIINYENS